MAADIAITGLGAVTSVGMDAVTTCASIRAGLARPALLDNASVLDLEDYREVPVTGHPAGALARGFSNVGRWLQLCAPALDDLSASADLPTASDKTFWTDTVCIVALPVLGERFLPDPNCSEEAIERAFVRPLMDRVGAAFAPARVLVHARGRAGVLECLAAASDRIQGHRCARVVVLAVDSLVDTPGLQWLLETARLKCDTNPVGLSPGESACAILLEHVGAATARGAKVLAKVKCVRTAAEPRAFSAGEVSQGDALAEVIAGVLRSGDVPTGAVRTTIADLNGELWRAQEFGAARSRVPRELWDPVDLTCPVESTGDMGAATVAVGIAYASRALARRHTESNVALVTCSDEDGAVGAVLLSAT